MAGIRCCYRRLLILNTARLPDRNGVLLQLTRKRSSLVVQMSSLQKGITLQKPNLYNTNKLIFYRLASTNVVDSKELASNSSLKVTEVKHDSEPVKLSKEADTVGSNPVVIDESSLPPIPSEVVDAPVAEAISMGLKEPTFHSLGLGSWWPSGCVQQALEYLHINLDLPWWQAIIIITCVIRTFLIPFTLANRRQSITLMNDHMPHVIKLNEKMREAQLRGDYYTMSVHNQELQKYIKENNINFFGFLKLSLIQTPIFISMYWALSGMVSAPVESLKTGGLLWFQDLTAPDPYYILPFTLATSLALVLETGAEGVPSMARSAKMKWAFRGLCVLLFLFTTKFAACLTWYWSISNFISLSLVGLYKIPVIKRYLKIPDIKPQYLEEVNKKKKKGFIAEFKEGIESAKITSQLQDRERMNMINFQKAGSGPVPRTFKKNPLLQNAKKAS